MMKHFMQTRSSASRPSAPRATSGMQSAFGLTPTGSTKNRWLVGITPACVSVFHTTKRITPGRLGGALT